MTPTTVLLRPSAEYAHLLDEGAFGERLPTLRHPAAGHTRCVPCKGSGLVPSGEYIVDNCPECDGGVVYGRAIVLYADGADLWVAQEAVMRVDRRWRTDLLAAYIEGAMGGCDLEDPEWDDVRRLVGNVGTLLLVDADGREL